jgi:hypothetical protein
MGALTVLIHRCVNEVSVVLQDIRKTRLLNEAVSLSAPSNVSQWWSGVSGKIWRIRNAWPHCGASCCAHLRMPSNWLNWVVCWPSRPKSRRLTGRSFAASLAQVSGEFDGVVEEIRNSLARVAAAFRVFQVNSITVRGLREEDKYHFSGWRSQVGRHRARSGSPRASGRYQ